MPILPNESRCNPPAICLRFLLPNAPAVDRTGIEEHFGRDDAILLEDEPVLHHELHVAKCVDII